VHRGLHPCQSLNSIRAMEQDSSRQQHGRKAAPKEMVHNTAKKNRVQRKVVYTFLCR
jgi:hypothetical protein